MLKRRGARIDPWGTPFLRRRNLLGLLSPVVRVKLLLRIKGEVLNQRSALKGLCEEQAGKFTCAVGKGT